MRIYTTIIGLLCAGAALNAQTNNVAIPSDGAYVFSYDDAGNQIFRGYVCRICPVLGKEGSPDELADKEVFQNDFLEEDFWSEVRIYPVPVRETLTIDWSDKADNLIAEVSLYEQNTVHWKFLQKNIPNLNRQVKVDMTHYYMGVYVLTFQLKDGRTVSKNITKF